MFDQTDSTARCFTDAISKISSESCASAAIYPSCLSETNMLACCTSRNSYELSMDICIDSYLPGCIDLTAQSSFYSTRCSYPVDATSVPTLTVTQDPTGGGAITGSTPTVTGAAATAPASGGSKASSSSRMGPSVRSVSGVALLGALLLLSM